LYVAQAHTIRPAGAAAQREDPRGGQAGH